MLQLRIRQAMFCMLICCNGRQAILCMLELIKRQAMFCMLML